jgi:prohibitin 1
LKLPKRFAAFFDRHALRISLSLLAVFVIVALVLPFSVYAVLPGQASVLWSRFGGGTQTKHVAMEGTHIKWPWNINYIYDVRSQTDTAQYEALTADGVTVMVEVSFRYWPRAPLIGFLHKYVGPDYPQILLRPEIASAVRSAISKYPTAALYSGRRDEIEDLISASVRQDQEDQQVTALNFKIPEIIQLREVLLRGVTLPPALEGAINEKMIQAQVSQEYQFRVDRERLEAERKRIEATGIRDFQAIVGSNLTEAYLRWTGIQATLHLAESPGSRTVIIGGREGLPLILNQPSGPDGNPGPAPDTGLLPSLLPRASPSVLDSPPLPLIQPPETTTAKNPR